MSLIHWIFFGFWPGASTTEEDPVPRDITISTPIYTSVTVSTPI
jgi:hypothetical protein